MWVVLLAVITLLLTPKTVSALDFGVSGAPETIFEDTAFPITFTLSQSSTATSVAYLRAVFYQEGTTKYFGYTQNQSGTWVNSTSDKTQFYTLTVGPDGSASGQIWAKLDLTHSYFTGAGVYKIKLGRYTSSNDTCADWTNELETAVTVHPSPVPSPNPSLPPSPTPTPTPSPSPIPSPSLIPSPRPSPSIALLSSPGTVAGETTVDLSAFGVASPQPSTSPSSTPTPRLNSTRARFALIVGSGLVLLSIASYLGFRLYRHRHIMGE